MSDYRAEQYAYRVFYSPEDESFVGKVAEFPSLSVIEDTPQEALAGIIDAVRFILADMAADGEVPPAPLSMASYSGKISLRMTPELHRRVAIAAAEQNVSINRYINARLMDAS